MKRLIIAAALAAGIAPAVNAAVNIKACASIADDAAQASIPRGVSPTMAEYQQMRQPFVMLCAVALGAGYEARPYAPEKLGALSDLSLQVYSRSYQTGAAQRKADGVENTPFSEFARVNGFDTQKERKYARQLWDHVMAAVRSVTVKPTGETCYLIVSHTANGKITGTRPDGGKSPSGNGPDGDAYCKAVEAAVNKVGKMPAFPSGFSQESGISLTYIFDKADIPGKAAADKVATDKAAAARKAEAAALKREPCYSCQIQSAFQRNLYDWDHYAGQRCTVQVQFARDGEVVSAHSEGGDAALCAAALKAVQSTKFPAAPSDETYQSFKNFTLNFGA